MLSSIIGEQENCLDAGNLVGIKHHFTKKKKKTANRDRSISFSVPFEIF